MQPCELPIGVPEDLGSLRKWIRAQIKRLRSRVPSLQRAMTEKEAQRSDPLKRYGHSIVARKQAIKAANSAYGNLPTLCSAIWWL